MATSFNDQFDQHGTWRREFALRLKLLGEWMKDHDLLDAAVEERLHRLEMQVRADKVMVAFPDAIQGAEWTGNPVRQEIAHIAPPAERLAPRSGEL